MKKVSFRKWAEKGLDDDEDEVCSDAKIPKENSRLQSSSREPTRNRGGLSRWS